MQVIRKVLISTLRHQQPIGRVAPNNYHLNLYLKFKYFRATKLSDVLRATRR